jgi:hypothetical protein
MSPILQSYLRTHRRNWCLTQREVAFLLGGQAGGQVSRYERLARTPTLEAALCCQVLFGPPPHEIFPGVFAEVERSIIERALALHRELDCGDPRPTLQRKLELLQAIAVRGERPLA